MAAEAGTNTGSLSDRTRFAALEAVAGRRRGFGAVLPFAGPAIMASVAYMDPGNFATNIQAGAHYGYTLLWVVVAASLVAMLLQGLSAKLGIVTGRNLAELCRERFPQPMVLSMWAASEVGAMATDLAEILGGAIGISLLAHVSLMTGMIAMGIATYAMLQLERKGFRPIEYLVAVLVGLIGLGYLVELLIARPDFSAVALHSVVPQLENGGAVVLAVGIVGATVMPHAIYLHSSLTQSRIPPRNDAERRRLLKFSNREVLIALGFAGLVNLAMVTVAASVFHDGHHNGVADIEDAYRTLSPLLGSAAAGIFLVTLLASGLSSSAVATMAGQIIMQGFVRFRIPLWLRRLATMLPAFVVIALGIDPIRALVLSQVVLSFVLPIPTVALLIFTSNSELMGPFRNGLLMVTLASACTAAILGLNALLLLQTFGLIPITE